MPVEIQDGLDAGVSEAGRDDGWVGAFGGTFGDSVLDVVEPGVIDRHGDEDRQGEAAQIRLITRLGRIATVGPPAGCLFGELADPDSASLWVNVAAFEVVDLDGDEEPSVAS